MRYAELHPQTKILVIDLCPQANSSMVLLGGGPVGEENIINFCKEATPRSVVGYLSTVITNGRGAQIPDPYYFVVNVSDYNTNAPQNLFLLCGDGNLEPMTPAINEAASAKTLTPTAQPWKWIQEIIKNFIEDITELSDQWLVFIDTNPSLAYILRLQYREQRDC